MTEEEYKIKLKQIDKERDKSLQLLYKEYALSNNPYKIGDIIKDHQSIIKIESIGIYKGYYFSGCKYFGTKLTSKLVPFKNGDKSTIYQMNILEKINTTKDRL